MVESVLSKALSKIPAWLLEAGTRMDPSVPMLAIFTRNWLRVRPFLVLEKPDVVVGEGVLPVHSTHLISEQDGGWGTGCLEQPPHTNRQSLGLGGPP